MNPLIPSRIKLIACSAIVVLFSACGGGGGSTDRPATLTAHVVSSPTSAAAAVPSTTPASAGSPSDLPAPGVPVATACPPEVCTGTQYHELTARPGPLDAPDAQPLSDNAVPGTEPLIDTGGEAPYPDLRTLPTRIMAFEPIAYGDVSAVNVTSVR